MNILVLNGVNLNMTGRREKGVYGTQTLREINERIERFAEKLGVTVKFFQNNLEGEICTAIQSAEGTYDGNTPMPSAIPSRPSRCPLSS